MCCFSRRVEKVADTSIFARAGRAGRQFLVYSMFVSAKEDLAMILPIPTPKDSPEDAVQFISLEDYPDFFKDMQRAFITPSRGVPLAKSKKDDAPPKLKVVEVGAFEASFVPKAADFPRLDERFRLPATTWDELPAYKDYGFAVFKLKSGAKKVHPMAFSFPRAQRGKLFFPTVHIHDGKVHKTAEFDHALYCQQSGEAEVLHWAESKKPARTFVKADKTGGIVEPDKHLYRLVLKGRKTNQDTWLA